MGASKVLVGKPEGKSPLGRHRRRWDDNINIDLQEVRCMVKNGSICLRLGTGVGHMLMRQ